MVSCRNFSSETAVFFRSWPNVFVKDIGVVEPARQMLFEILSGTGTGNVTKLRRQLKKILTNTSSAAIAKIQMSPFSTKRRKHASSIGIIFTDWTHSRIET